MEDPSKRICEACIQKQRNPRWKKHGHELWCTKSIHHKRTNGGQIDRRTLLLNEADEELKKKYSKPFCGEELHSLAIKKTQADVHRFLEPRRQRLGQQQSSQTKQQQDQAYIDDPFTVAHLKGRIQHYMANPTPPMANDSNSVPMVIGAAIEALLEAQTTKCKQGTNELQLKTAIPRKNYEIYKKQFLPGTLGFTFPRDDKTKEPDPYYSQLEGRTIYCVRWELNVPGIHLKCPCCPNQDNAGELIHQKYDFRQVAGFATALIGVKGETDWAVAMKYKCNKCETTLRGNDGRLLATLPAQLRNAYPVDPRYAKEGATRHLQASFTNVMEPFMITHGNGNQLCILLSELMAANHLKYQLEYLSQARDTKTTVKLPPVGFKDWIGPWSPSGQDLRNLRNEAATSTLTSTGVSDKDRVRREIQSVGASKSTCNDHTFRVMSNYISKEVHGAKCAHTIGTETGEVASVAIVPDVGQQYYAHQAEQFSRRLNVNPIVHVSDICPKGTKLWKKLMSKGSFTIICCLGWFHFLQRITKTLFEEHRHYKAAIHRLRECLYWFDTGDLEKVTRQIAAGNLGRMDGEICPEEKRTEKAKEYRNNIRVWSYDEETIQQKLMGWYSNFKEDHDETIAADLFTSDTVKAVEEQMRNAKWVVDPMERKDLYTQLTPGSRSKTNLPIYEGARGSESKLEKAHHAIFHFGNSAMRRSFADFLGMAGIARYNRNIRHRQRMARLPPEERKKVPVCFHEAAHYTNHLELAAINQLAADLGLDPIHKDVEVLPEDNGERFFSEYLKEQLKRDEEDGVTYGKETKQCMCKACGGRNPYAARRPIVEGAVRAAPSLLKHASPPAASIQQPEEQEQTLVPLALAQPHSYYGMPIWPPTIVQRPLGPYTQLTRGESND